MAEQKARKQWRPGTRFLSAVTSGIASRLCRRSRGSRCARKPSSLFRFSFLKRKCHASNSSRGFFISSRNKQKRKIKTNSRQRKKRPRRTRLKSIRQSRSCCRLTVDINHVKSSDGLTQHCTGRVASHPRTALPKHNKINKNEIRRGALGFVNLAWENGTCHPPATGSFPVSIFERGRAVPGRRVKNEKARVKSVYQNTSRERVRSKVIT